jgi:hypothetical protein
VDYLLLRSGGYKNMKFYFTIKDKKIIQGSKTLSNFLLSLNDGKYVFSIKKDRKVRSLQQNALYWKWVSIIADYFGYDAEEMHIYFRAKFLVDRTKIIPRIRSTTELNILEFMEYMDKISLFSAEHNIELPVCG